MFRRMPGAQTSAAVANAGPAGGVRWDLSHLYDGPDDPRLDADLDRALSEAREFESRQRGQVAALAAADLAAALDALEAIYERMTRAASYADLLFSSDPARRATGRCSSTSASAARRSRTT